ncbi:MAG: hypothetical protein LUD14_04075 [Clostridiales bacterium]|nr:hypothetical protein [Clostridiales bacterium]
MRKKIAVIMALATLSISVAACGSSSESSDSGSTAEEETVSDTESSEAAEEGDSGETAPEITFEGLTVVDNEECSIKITEIDPDDLWGYTLKAEFENKSSDKTYMFAVENASVNGVSSDPFFASEVAAEKKSNEEISFSDSDLEENGIDDFTDIELTFRVYDSDDWEAEDVAYETVHVYPYGKENATAFVRESQETDNVIVDNDYVTVIVTGYEEDDLWGYTVNMYLVNKTDSTVMFGVDEASVNGYMADPFYAESVPAGKSAFSAMYWDDSELEENGITTVEEIEFQLRAYDEDDWEADDYVNEVVMLNP